MKPVYHYVVLFSYSIIEYCLGKTKKIAANSAIELILWGCKRIFKRKEKENEKYH